MEPKPNNCEIIFRCNDMETCVYFSEKSDGICKYYDWGQSYCCSTVAQVNAMTLELKKLTGKEKE